jgi:hypothetical protein
MGAAFMNGSSFCGKTREQSHGDYPMPMPSPLTLGPFTVDEQGRLTPRDNAAFPAFNFLWRGRSVRAFMPPSDPRDGRLKLQTILGRVPSTAGGDLTGQRLQSFASLRTVRRGLPEEWEIHLRPNHSAMLEAVTQIALPITAIGLVTEMTRFLLILAPYLDLLDEGGVAGVAISPGIVNN